MRKHTQLMLLLAASLSLAAPVRAQSPAPKDATTADEVVAPANQQVPLEEPAAPPQAAAEEPTDDTAPIDSREEEARRARRGVGVALRLSLLQGFGIEAIYNLNKHFNVRGQVNYLSINRNFNKDGVDYDGHVKFRTIGALLDYHPFAGSFRMSLGLYNDGNHIDANAACRSGSQCTVGNDNVTSASPGDDPTIHAGIDMRKGVAPYFGFGWGNAMKGWPVHFGFDIGVIYQGSPTVSLTARGQATVCDTQVDPGCAAPQSVNLAGNTTPQEQQFQSQLAQERNDLQKSIDDTGAAKFFPAISFTVGYRFGS